MARRLRSELADAIEFDDPQGGMFIWGRLTGNRNATKVAKRAIERRVAYVPGVPFYASDVDVSTLRLSFAAADSGMIEEGIKRLSEAVRAER